MGDGDMWHSKINPLGNYEDQAPPVEYAKALPQWARHVCWAFRNPAHNFMFHWVGVYGEVDRVIGDWKEPGLQKTYIQTSEGLYPMLSYNGKYVEWYVGWRPNGAFGIALRKAKSKQAGQ